MKWFLIVLFLTPSGGLELREGWHPLEIESQPQCHTARKNVDDYLTAIDQGDEWIASCREFASLEELLRFLALSIQTP